MATIEGITKEPTVNFVGKDGFFWWVGEVEDNQDPMELGRVKVRVLGYYTNVRGGTTDDLPTDNLPWATVLQHTSQSGNLVIVHNGIIENYDTIKQELISRGYTFHSDTDTEVLINLIKRFLNCDMLLFFL